ncbi:hypothetical protein CRG98_023875 [Punica granatum]|uniref:Uncharacterized protein n=1 Tax=Punica granatum TaxID=22663 RepID=A0A2I0JID5_PUNGR|nr:hypothetical protein CRG98_023875 [Punica granatum]
MAHICILACGARRRLQLPPASSPQRPETGTAVLGRRTLLLHPTSSSPLTLLLTGSAHLLVCAGPTQQIRPSPLCPVQPRRSDPFRLASGSAWNARPVSPADSAQLQHPAQLARAPGPARPAAAQLSRVRPNPRARPRPPHARPDSPAQRPLCSRSALFRPPGLV